MEEIAAIAVRAFIELSDKLCLFRAFNAPKDTLMDIKKLLILMKCIYFTLIFIIYILKYLIYL